MIINLALLVYCWSRFLYFLILVEVFLISALAVLNLTVWSSVPIYPLAFITIVACEAAIGICVLVEANRWDSGVNVGLVAISLG